MKQKFTFCNYCHCNNAGSYVTKIHTKECIGIKSKIAKLIHFTKFNLIVFITMFFINIQLIYAQQEYALGDIPITQEEYNQLPKIDISQLAPIQSISMQQSSSTATPNLILNLITPTPGDQGSLGSCAAWAVGYCASSILAYNKYNNMTAALRSPMFLYNETFEDGNSCTSGRTVYEVLTYVKENGICQYDLMPYYSICDSVYVRAQNNSMFDAGLNRIVNWGTTTINDVDNLKSILTLGYPIVISFQVNESFYTMWNTDAIWNTIDDNTGTYIGNHACCIVGYDDVNDMFKVMNSWGSTSGDNGYFWITYDMIEENTLLAAYVLYGIKDDTYPTLFGNETLSINGDYYIKNLPSDAAVEWRCITTATAVEDVAYTRSALNITEKNDSTATFSMVRCPTVLSNGCYIHRGATDIRGEITLSNGAYQYLDKTILSTAPYAPIIDYTTPMPVWYKGQSRTLDEIVYSNSSGFPYIFTNTDVDIEWTILRPDGVGIQVSTYDLTYTPTVAGSHIFIVMNKLGIPNYNADTVYHTIINPSVVIGFNNPVTTQLNTYVYTELVEETNVASVSDVNTSILSNSTLYQGNYTIEIWSDMGIVYSQDIDGNTPNLQIPLAGLANGYYVVRLLIDDILVDTKQLLKQ